MLRSKVEIPKITLTKRRKCNGAEEHNRDNEQGYRQIPSHPGKKVMMHQSLKSTRQFIDFVNEQRPNNSSLSPGSSSNIDNHGNEGAQSCPKRSFDRPNIVDFGKDCCEISMSLCFFRDGEECVGFGTHWEIAIGVGW